MLDDTPAALPEAPLPGAQSTAAILVVKGAGLQRHGDTLDLFVRGFWRAARNLDPEARLSAGESVVRPEGGAVSSRGTEVNGAAPAAVDNEPFLITSKYGTVILREVNWEAALRPRSAMDAIRKEWEMAVCVLQSRVAQVVLPMPKAERRFPHGALSAYWRTAAFLWSAFALYWVAFAVWAGLPDIEGATWVFVLAYSSALIAWLPLWALELSGGRAPQTDSYAHLSSQANRPSQHQPSIVFLVVLGIVFLLRPVEYVLVLVVVGVLVTSAVAWKSRRWRPSVDEAGVEGTLPRWRRWLVGTIFGVSATGVLYRFAVVLSLPVMGLVMAISRLLNWIPATRSVGRALDGLSSRILSGIMGDVVSYATDPTQAARMRLTLEREIARLHHDDSVQTVHVVAHSQGTALAFECLYASLEPPYRQKLRTLITMGSPLSFYNGAGPVLYDAAGQRFPAPRAYPDFPDTSYRWFNFWSFSDPITEFSGLDEYAFPAGRSPSMERDKAGPHSIKTRFQLRNHTAYWHDQDAVMGPLAARVMCNKLAHSWEQRVPAAGAAAADTTSALSAILLYPANVILGLVLMAVVYVARVVLEWGSSFVAAHVVAVASLAGVNENTESWLAASAPNLQQMLLAALVLAYLASVLTPWWTLVTGLAANRGTAARTSGQ